MWRKYGLEVDDDERKSIEFFEDKCPKHEKGIKLNRVRRWLGTWFEGFFLKCKLSGSVSVNRVLSLKRLSLASGIP